VRRRALASMRRCSLRASYPGRRAACRLVGIRLVWAACAGGSPGLRTRTPRCGMSSGGWRPKVSGYARTTSGYGRSVSGCGRATSGCAPRSRRCVGRPSARPPPVLQGRPHSQPQAVWPQARCGLRHPRPPAAHPSRSTRSWRSGCRHAAPLVVASWYWSGSRPSTSRTCRLPAAGDPLPGRDRPLPCLRSQGPASPPRAGIRRAGRRGHPAWRPGGGAGGLA
jgi:hypothetical protein